MKHPNDDLVYKLLFVSLAITCDVIIIFYSINHFLSLTVLAQFLFALLLHNLVQYKTIKIAKKESEKKQNLINEYKITLDIIDIEVPSIYIQKVNNELHRKDKILKIDFKK